MQALDLTLLTLEENLALDEALLLQAEAGQSGEALRLWEWPTPAVVLGAGGRLAEEVHEPNCRADGVPVLRRASGGGTVLLGPGCLLYSLVLAYERSPLLAEIKPSYAYVLGRIRDALAGLLLDIRCAGTSDLAAGGRKFSGNAQQRKRRNLLHHGTLLYDFDVSSLGRYLRQPARQPAYRAGRDHEAFVMNLPADAYDLRRRLRVAWDTGDERKDWPSDLVRQLVVERYGTGEWNRRR
jgi:lipoate-protein ligase A